MSVKRVRYSPARGLTLSQMRDGIPDDLGRIGDAVLVWANEGDLCLAGERIEPTPEKDSGDGRE